MKKTEIYVPIANKKEAEQAKAVLEALGEPHNGLPFYEQTPEYGGLYFNDRPISKRWCLAASLKGHPVKQITMKQLIELLVRQSHQSAGDRLINEAKTTIHYAEDSKIPLEKIAVRVDNEKEFNALMRYYDSLGWESVGLSKPLDVTYYSSQPYVRFEDGFGYSKDYAINAGYKIIPFSDFAKEHNIKLPLIKSDDGVWLYEGDIFYGISKSKNEWDFDYWGCKNYNFTLDLSDLGKNGFNFPYIETPQTSKIFSNKQVALDWIEAQKPKHIYLDISNSMVNVKITKDAVTNLDNLISMGYEDIKAIHKAMEELNNG